jgi:hypothetical protein
MKSLILIPVAILFRITFAIIFKLSNCKQIKIGKCVFRGSDKFLELCQKAMIDLNRLDEDLFYAVISRNDLTFYESTKAGNGPPNIYLISKDYCAWSSEGVITSVLYASFRADQISGRLSVPRMEWDRIKRDIDDRLFRWLSDHDFPEELTSLFGSDESKDAGIMTHGA